ncbi:MULTISPECIES: hypothetical protein [Rhodomicrobium]|uniref:hypothetical protein n=1 Tax=Rhodomicrobium TaxID=1068 RepID=UPI0015957F6E|nr:MULTISPECIES: hypothetical protein [Rhodomicrobium]
MSKRCVAVFLALALVPGAPAFAQSSAPGPTAPLGATSPLGFGPSSPVGTPGIPLGAMELPTPGESPVMPGTIVPGMTSTDMAGQGSQGQAMTSSPGGVAGTTSVGRVGIPLGATEISPGGLSPMPPVTPVDPTMTGQPGMMTQGQSSTMFSPGGTIGSPAAPSASDSASGGPSASSFSSSGTGMGTGSFPTVGTQSRIRR